MQSELRFALFEKSGAEQRFALLVQAVNGFYNEGTNGYL
jgi:hypothetical protein